jgi:hypothetical protein
MKMLKCLNFIQTLLKQFSNKFDIKFILKSGIANSNFIIVHDFLHFPQMVLCAKRHSSKATEIVYIQDCSKFNCLSNKNDKNVGIS